MTSEAAIEIIGGLNKPLIVIEQWHEENRHVSAWHEIRALRRWKYGGTFLHAQSHEIEH